MIYLICAKDSKQRFVNILEKEERKRNAYYKYFVDNFEHKNILYSLDFYKHVSNELLPHRVNIIYTHGATKKLPNIVNAIVLNNTRDLVRSYKNDIDDVYIFVSDTWMIEEFGKLADYLIVFASDEIGYTMQQISDLIDFSNYNLIRTEKPEDAKYKIEYYVSNKVGK